MSDTAPDKIVDAWATLIGAWSDLSGETVIVDQSVDEAVEAESYPCTVIQIESWGFQRAMEQGQELHTIVVNFDRIDSSAQVGVVSRANRTALAHVVAALHSDPSLGGRLQDCDWRDVASPMADGKSVSGASLQAVAQFYTPAGDHFTIAGVGGDTF